MIYREAEAIEARWRATHLGRPLAKLHVPNTPVTPGELSKLSSDLPGPALRRTGQPDRRNQEEDQPNWMDQMVQDMNTPRITNWKPPSAWREKFWVSIPSPSLLDDVCVKYDQEQLVGQRPSRKTPRGRAANRTADNPPGHTPPASAGSNPWLLDDGPVDPETLGRAGGIPPLVYSNSYRALPELGQRFIAAGASTFIGPVVPLFSRPARIFSGYCYQAMGDGWCAGAAVWKAAQSCRAGAGQ